MRQILAEDETNPPAGQNPPLLLKSEPNIKLNTEGLSRGINSCQIGVSRSYKYCRDVKKLTTLLVPQTAIPNPGITQSSLSKFVIPITI